MAELHPQSFEVLLRRMAHELARGACFDLPARSFHRAPTDLDFSVRFHGERAANPLGPAAGPHTQLAQNIVLSYLAGARILELKTVQVQDALVIPRPCIDAANVGFNVEWSQELPLAESLPEYVKAWVLLHALRHVDLGLGLAGPAGDFLLDLSVGYDLAGVQTPKVRRFLDGMLDARAEIDALFETWPLDLRAYRPERERVDGRVSSCVTLSTFHGCPAEQIERIGEHLLTEVGLHLVVKLNPTLLGYERVRQLLHDQLGYRDIVPHAPAFEQDLQWDDALGLVRRLGALAERRGLHFGAKFSNTLVVENHKRFFPASERLMYLSGQPLHVLTFELCRRFREAVGPALPISFSAGVDSRNFPDCVASGFVPVTTCTDLLRPGGYGRLPRYLDQLAQRMRQRGVRDLASFTLAEAGVMAPANEPRAVAEASLQFHAAAARRVLEDPRYRAEQNSAVPRRLGRHLWLFDCVSCDKCVQVCPNDANFSLEVPAPLKEQVELPDLVVRAGRVVEEGGRVFRLTDAHQLANYADWCNECGNCDVFCPEDGGPYVVKPRFFSSRRALESASPALDGFVLERYPTGDLLVGRHEGRPLSLWRDAARSRARFCDEFIEVQLSYPAFARLEVSLRGRAPEGHRLRLDWARGMAALLDGALMEGAVSPVNARFLGPPPPPPVLPSP